MMKLKDILCFSVLAVALALPMSARGADAMLHVKNNVTVNDSIAGELAADLEEDDYLNKKVIVGNDTISVIIPERNYGRYHRGLYTHLFVPKGQFSCGLQASYGSVSSEDLQVLSYITDMDFDGTTYSFKPYLCYFYNHNKCLGVRLGFSRNEFNLNNFSVDFDDDINFDVRDVKYYTNSTSVELFRRNYIGLDNSRRFAVFNEVALKYGSGSGKFQRLYDDEPKLTETKTNELRLDFSPGLCVFIQEKVAFNVSFGIFGWYYRSDKQVTNGVDEGSRSSSGANFKINLLNLKLGIAIFL
ncbi:MAG: hypothetical protein ACI4AH_00995 [Muribaculaceae bacterium]